jgi:DNA-directed RNA polymerase subunit RPC12/RpoP
MTIQKFKCVNCGYRLDLDCNNHISVIEADCSGCNQHSVFKPKEATR